MLPFVTLTTILLLVSLVSDAEPSKADVSKGRGRQPSFDERQWPPSIRADNSEFVNKGKFRYNDRRRRRPKGRFQGMGRRPARLPFARRRNKEKLFEIRDKSHPMLCTPILLNGMIFFSYLTMAAFSIFPFKNSEMKIYIRPNKLSN